MSFSGQNNIILIKKKRGKAITWHILRFCLLLDFEGVVRFYQLPRRYPWFGYLITAACTDVATLNPTIQCFTLFPNRHNRSVLCKRRKYLAVRAKPAATTTIHCDFLGIKPLPQQEISLQVTTLESGSRGTGRGHNGDDTQHVPLAPTGAFPSLRSLKGKIKKRGAIKQDKRHS